jgi:broad specificity phosphatase PhoE
MSEIRLFIARHGETEYNRKGLLQGRGINAPLNETGKKQAIALANYLGTYQTDRMACSTLVRAYQTAEYCKGQNNVDFTKNPDLDEMDFGDYEGKDYNDVTKELSDLANSWKRGDLTTKIPGGESPRGVFDRANAAVESYMESLQTGTIVLIVHGRLIKILLSEWLGYGLKNMDLIEHHNGCVNQLIYKNGIFEPVYLNKTDHLKVAAT